jgi:hypothetical protein
MGVLQPGKRGLVAAKATARPAPIAPDQADAQCPHVPGIKRAPAKRLDEGSAVTKIVVRHKIEIGCDKRTAFAERDVHRRTIIQSSNAS